MIILRKQFSEGPRKSRELRFKDPGVRFRGKEPEEGEEDEELEDPIDEESEDTEPEFDEDILEQKEYTSWGFKAKAYIGRARNNIARKFYYGAQSAAQKQEEAVKQAMVKPNLPNISRVMPGLGQEAKKSGSTIIMGKSRVGKNPGLNFTMDMHQMAERIPSGSADLATKKVLKNNITGRADTNVVVVNNGSPVTLAHELGHAKRHTQGNLVSRFDRGYARGISSTSNNSERGIKNIFKRFVSNKVTVAEEAGASREGLKMLKRAGATPEELQVAKQSLDAAGNTYKYHGRSTLLNTIGNTFATKGRRNLSLAEKASEEVRKETRKKAVKKMADRKRRQNLLLGRGFGSKSNILENKLKKRLSGTSQISN